MRKFALAILVMAIAGPALAQNSPLIIDRDRADRNVQVPASMGAPIVNAPPSMVTRMVVPFALREVRVQGTSLDGPAIAAATQSFIGQTIDGPGLQRLSDAVAAAYERSDIALYTVAVPDQDFTGGVLILRATEYHLESVNVTDGKDRDLSLVSAYADRLTAERPLRKSTLQRYVSLIRDIPGATPVVGLTPGAAPDADILTVALNQKRMEFGLSVNNSGSDLLGRYQFQGDVYFYGLLRQGEQTRFTYGTPPDLRRFQYFAFSETQPIGSDGTQLQFNAGLLQTRPKGLPIRGEAVTMQLLANHPLIRSYDENLYVSGSIDGLNSENAVLGQNFANERVRTLRGAMSYSKTNLRNAFGLSGTISFGLDGLGAREPSPLIAVSDFVKFNGQAAYNRQVWENWFVRLKANGQYSADRVPTSELYAVGGGDFARDFPAASIVGDSGVAGNAEVAWRPQGLGSFLQGSEAYVFTDRERTWYRRRIFAEQRFDLSAVGIGTRLAIGAKTILQLEAANVLDAPSFIARAGDWRFSFGLRSTY